jgi:4-amino-4-deoxy-L-arabinose transferase-like glycosyltransferase
MVSSENKTWRLAGFWLSGDTEQRFVGAILIAYAVLALLFATRTPAWQAPDEPAHYLYIAQVANGTLIPIITAGDWQNDYLEQLKAARFQPALLADFDLIQYEDHQPPLYYWLLAPVYRLTNGNLYVLRIISILFTVGTVALAYRIGREVFPQRPNIAVSAMALVAFLPQHIAISAALNNDALANLLIALTLWQLLRYVQGQPIPAWRLGLLVGLIFITKTTGYFMAGVVLLGLALTSPPNSLSDFREGNRWWARLRPLLVFLLVGGIFAAAWWGRNLSVYGVPDFLGLRAHDAVVVGQLRTADLIADIGFGAYLQRAVTTTFNSFWGQFGWMGVPMDNIPLAGLSLVYPLITLLVLAALAGLAIQWVQGDNRRIQSSALILLGVIALTALMFLYYNTQFVQFQGRYLFPALIPVALGLAWGLEVWRYVLLGRNPRSYWLTVALLSSFALLDAYLIWRVIPGALGYP